jgi:hypothetical protein
LLGENVPLSCAAGLPGIAFAWAGLHVLAGTGLSAGQSFQTTRTRSP